jgi:hypothetical protein
VSPHGGTPSETKAVRCPERRKWFECPASVRS